MLLIRQEVERLILQARGLPQPERLAPRLTNTKILDLTFSDFSFEISSCMVAFLSMPGLLVANLFELPQPSPFSFNL